VKVVVITGSTSGIGLGLAGAFLERGCAVVISGRSQVNLDKARQSIEDKHGGDRVLVQLCDVSRYADVQGLWEAAKQRFGKVDIWINNAGAAHPQTMLGDFSPDVIEDVVASNITGVLYGLNIALRGMREQGHGGIYNMEGLGSGGGPIIKGLALYACTKSAVSYLTKAAVKEVAGTSVIVGGLRPGMVATKLITAQYEGRAEEWKASERIFNILSDRVETIVPWMAERILANQKNGAHIHWLTPSKTMGRFMTARFKPRHVFDEAPE
jgi:NAD(P)-dependent dehydrogenase (short-subunit alcohol dehydrogenase family)